jgi:hypothetical protein
MVEPGTRGKDASTQSSTLSATLSVWAARKAARRRPGPVRQGQDLGGQQAGVLGARLADGQGGHGNAARHLDDRQQGIEAAEGLGLHRHAQHRQVGHRGGHARQVGRAAGAGDDHLEARGLARPWRSRTGARGCGGPRRPWPPRRRPGWSARRRRAFMVGQSERLPMMMATGGVWSWHRRRGPLGGGGPESRPVCASIAPRKCKTPCAPWKRAPAGRRDHKPLRLKRAPIAPNGVPVNN